MATDVLPGERYEQARGLLTLCQKYHLLENYSESSFDRETRAKEIVHTLVDRAMLAKGFARYAAALVMIICEGSAEAEEFANTLLEEQTEGQNSDTVTPVPPKQQTQNQTTPKEQFAQPQNLTPQVTTSTPEAQKGMPQQSTQPQVSTQPQKPNNPSDFYIVDGVLKAYRGRDAHVVVPSNVKAIAGKAFQDCRFLKSVVVPKNVKSIASGAFAGCSSLESITLPFVGAEMKRSHENYQKPLGFIFGTSKFDDAMCITQHYYGSFSTYYVPESLKHVTVTGGYMLAGAFDGCKNIETITFTPEKDNYQIGYYMFRNCESLKTFDIPTGIKKIGRYAFENCYELQSITIPQDVDEIDCQTFCGCKSLTTVTLPSGIKTIAYSAFRSCDKLKEMEIPAGTTFIGDEAFKFCPELEKVTIPKSVEKIGKDAFASCPKLTIYKEGGLKPWEIFGTKWNPNRRPVKKI